MTPAEISDTAIRLLRRFYGFSAFRPMQLDIITAVMQRQDCVVIMPTGGGKSVCYQLPALMSEGCAIIISPLLALMQDQVSSLMANGIPAAAVNSMQTPAENRHIMEQVFAGRIKLLYISPERFLADSPGWSDDMPLSFIAIDEAHCISQWGHDFRPDYIRLGEIRKSRPGLPIIALTATADRLTREDIAKRLGLDSPRFFISSFDRPNISLEILPAPTAAQRLRIISRMIDAAPDDSGIVYCLTRKTTEDMARSLCAAGYRAAPYHAKLSRDLRIDTQSRFKNGDLQVVCATIAFGMGIDKSNIRWVVHNNMPANIESYYQEIGRAGRDGLPARALMFYSGQDVMTHRFFIEESGQPLVKTEKLNRIIALTQSQICRRRVLLSYFNEVTDHDCGNCDVCRNPPETFDALRPVQMALSAILRSGQTIGMTMTIDILRASRTQDIAARGLDRIPTFGVGRDIPASQWRYILTHMLLCGIIDVHPERGNILFVTDYGRTLLQPDASLSLPVAPRYNAGRRQGGTRPEAPPLSREEQILTELKTVRKSISAKESIPPYMVFSDKTLQDLAVRTPLTLEEFATVDGVSDSKAVRYWRRFSTVFHRHAGQEQTVDKTSTESVTCFLLRRGYSVADIARIRQLTPYTIYTHLTTLFREGQITDCSQWVTPAQIALVRQEIAQGYEGLYDRIGSRIPKGMTRLILALISDSSR